MATFSLYNNRRIFTQEGKVKNKWLFITIGLVAILATVVLTGCDQGSAALGEVTQLNLSSQQQGIWVTGQGEVSGAPDIATLRLGIEAQAASVADAQEQAQNAMSKVMDALAANGIDEKDIQTQRFNIQQMTRWDPNRQEEEITGYRVTNIVTVKVRDIDNTGTVIDAVAQAGEDMTRVDSIDFSIEDPADLYEEARKEAMADAKAKAEQLADLAGVNLDKPTYISETLYTPPVYSRAAVDLEEAQAGTPISPGELDISISLQVAYAIR